MFSHKINNHSVISSSLSIEKVKSNLVGLKNDLVSGVILQEPDWDYCILQTLTTVSKQDINKARDYWTNNCVSYFKTHRAVGLRSINEKKKQIVINRKNGLKIWFI